MIDITDIHRKNFEFITRYGVKIGSVLLNRQGIERRVHHIHTLYGWLTDINNNPIDINGVTEVVNQVRPTLCCDKLDTSLRKGIIENKCFFLPENKEYVEVNRNEYLIEGVIIHYCPFCGTSFKR